MQPGEHRYTGQVVCVARACGGPRRVLSRAGWDWGQGRVRDGCQDGRGRLEEGTRRDKEALQRLA